LEYHRIVVPLDGSETAEAAVPVAQKLAQQLRIPLCLVRVVDGADLPDLPEAGRPDPLAGEIVAAQCRAKEYLAHVQTRLSERDLCVTTDVRRGRAGPQLLAALHGGDLVIMAASGHSAQRIGLSSVVYTVLGRARVPVLVVPPVEEIS
jgi:nucleotide-binding universal stress UspA family protein